MIIEIRQSNIWMKESDCAICISKESKGKKKAKPHGLAYINLSYFELF